MIRTSSFSDWAYKPPWKLLFIFNFKNCPLLDYWFRHTKRLQTFLFPLLHHPVVILLMIQWCLIFFSHTNFTKTVIYKFRFKITQTGFPLKSSLLTLLYLKEGEEDSLGVQPQVVGQAWFGSEGFTAQTTCERLHACVHLKPNENRLLTQLLLGTCFNMKICIRFSMLWP